MIRQPESIPLQEVVRRRTRNEVEQEEETGEEVVVPGGGTDEVPRTPTIDVHSIAGLITILSVNIHQVESLVQVGTDLGFKFWLNSVLVTISIVCVYPLLVLRMLQGEGIAPSPCRYWASFGLMVAIFTTNLTLQIFNDLEAQCTVLLNQPLPHTQEPPHYLRRMEQRVDPHPILMLTMILSVNVAQIVKYRHARHTAIDPIVHVLFWGAIVAIILVGTLLLANVVVLLQTCWNRRWFRTPDPFYGALNNILYTLNGSAAVQLALLSINLVLQIFDDLSVLCDIRTSGGIS